MDQPLQCLDCNTTEEVEYRTTPDRTDFKSFPRCPECFDKRLGEVQQNLELTSPCRAPWYDESYAGEVWDEAS